MTYPTTYSDRLTIGCVVQISVSQSRPGKGPASAYHYGIGKPHYAVPALRGWNIPAPHGGGVKDNVTRIGATYLDWSRGYLEVY